jgi:TusA-related sulfurtransferase
MRSVILPQSESTEVIALSSAGSTTMNTTLSTRPTAPPITAVAEAIVSREFARLADMFDPNIEFRALTPDGLQEAAGADEAIRLLADWFGDGHAQELLINEPFTVGGRLGLRYRLRRKLGETPETATWYLLEQHCFADVGPLGIERLSLVCSGHTPETTATVAGAVHEFDAGNLGCSDGLPQEFMRRIRSVEVGDELRVITRDPSARQDLPSLARMNGHDVAPPEEIGGGRTLFVIKRRR